MCTYREGRGTSTEGFGSLSTFVSRNWVGAVLQSNTIEYCQITMPGWYVV